MTSRKRGRRQYPIEAEWGLSSFADEYLSRQAYWCDDAPEDVILDWLRERAATTYEGRSAGLERFTIAYAVWLAGYDKILFRSKSLIPYRRREYQGGPEASLTFLISYPSGENAEERRRRGRQISRDVCAIRYLAETGITPQEVKSLAATKGEGLDAWSRRASKIPKPVSAAEEPIEPSLSRHPERIDSDTFVTITRPADGGGMRWVIADEGLIRDLMTHMSELLVQRPDAVAIVDSDEWNEEDT